MLNATQFVEKYINSSIQSPVQLENQRPEIVVGAMVSLCSYSACPGISGLGLSVGEVGVVTAVMSSGEVRWVHIFMLNVHH